MIGKCKFPLVVIFIPPFICSKYFCQAWTMDPAQFYVKTDMIPVLMNFTSVRETDSWDLNRIVPSYAKGNKKGKVINLQSEWWGSSVQLESIFLGGDNKTRGEDNSWKEPPCGGWSLRIPGNGNSRCKGWGMNKEVVPSTAPQVPRYHLKSVNMGKRMCNRIGSLHFTLS